MQSMWMNLTSGLQSPHLDQRDLLCWDLEPGEEVDRELRAKACFHTAMSDIEIQGV